MNFPENITYNDPIEFEYLSKKEQDLLLDWCDLIGKISTINQKHTSYGLKHIFEKSQYGFYITNGMLKGAMLKSGYKYKLSHPTSPNWCFNISEKGLNNLLKLNKEVK